MTFAPQLYPIWEFPAKKLLNIEEYFIDMRGLSVLDQEDQSKADYLHERVLTWSVSDHQDAKGLYFRDRYAGLLADVAAASEHGLWQYFRTHRGRIGRVVEVEDEGGRAFSGVNGGSQDYLGLSGDPRVAEASIAAVRQFGVHSSGSAPMGGRTKLAARVESRLRMALGMPHVCLFPTGWGAGYGIIRGLVRPFDHVAIDALAHNCLQHGAAASTGNVHRFIHNDLGSLRKRLARIRQREPEAAILIVTEGLFSMDSDAPDFAGVLELKAEFDAMLLVDVAHDFGCLGPGGRGLLTDSADYADVDYVVGSFSKTFASIGGFFASNDLASIRAVQGFSGTYTFSNYLIPAQLGAIDAALSIVFGPEGDDLREALLANTDRLRAGLAQRGIDTVGRPSAMTIILAGSEARARLAYRHILANGVILNCIEFPAVRRGETRFRVQLTPQHDAAEIDRIVAGIADGLEAADAALPRI